jgi:hypothetical protein
MSEAQTYTLGQKVQVPIRLRDEDGSDMSQPSSGFWRARLSAPVPKPRTPQGSSWRATEKGKPKPSYQPLSRSPRS